MSTVTLSLSKLYRAIESAYGGKSEAQKFRNLVEQYQPAGQDTFVLEQDPLDQHRVRFNHQIQLTNTNSIGGELTFYEDGEVSESNELGQDHKRLPPAINRFLIALTLGPKNLEKPFSEEEAATFAGAKKVYEDAKTKGSSKAGAEAKIRAMLLLGFQMAIQAQEETHGEEEEKITPIVFQYDKEINNTHSSSPTKLEECVQKADEMVGKLLATADGAYLCSETLGKCAEFKFEEKVDCKVPKEIPSGQVHAFIYRGALVYREGATICRPPVSNPYYETLEKARGRWWVGNKM